MKLALAVEKYVARRRSDGSPFVSSELKLKALCRWCGHIELSDLSAAKVSDFLNSPRCAAVTRVSKFSSVKCFVNYWSLRGEMPALDLDKPARPQSVPGPFIYTRGQVKALLHATERCQSRAIKLDSRTVRMMMLTLYATGCSVDEVFNLRRSDVSFTNKRICFKNNQAPRARCVPIGGESREGLRRCMIFEGGRDHVWFCGLGKPWDRKWRLAACLFARWRPLAGLQRTLRPLRCQAVAVLV